MCFMSDVNTFLLECSFNTRIPLRGVFVFSTLAALCRGRVIVQQDGDGS